MSRLLTGSFVVLSVFCFGASASWKQGYYAGALGGYSKISGKLKTSSTLVLSGQDRGTVAGNDASKGSYMAGAFLGHRATFGRRHFSAELGVSYFNAEPKVGELTANATNAALGLTNGSTYSLLYKPRFGGDLSIRAGYLFMPELLGYVKLGVSHNIGQYILKAGKKTTVGVNVTSLVPGVGVEGKINDRYYWLAAVDYKWAIKTSKKSTGLGFTNRPRELVGKVGLGFSL